MTLSGMPDIDDDDFSFFQRRILALSGIHLSSVKKDLVRARLISRLSDLGLPTIKAYRQYLGTLASHDDEWQLLINQITTNKTDFFREPAHFKFLLDTFLPKWDRLQPNGRLRVWSAACSTGEEPYTLAMVLNRYFQDESRFEILASDIDTEVLEKASNGVYPVSRLPEIPFEYHAGAFVKGKGDVQKWFKIKKNLQARIKFARINLLEVNPDEFQRFDIVFCRNVFIYFQPETIQQIIGSFNRALNPGGALILGHSESLNVDHKRWKPHGSSIYYKEASSKTESLAPAKPAPLVRSVATTPVVATMPVSAARPMTAVAPTAGYGLKKKVLVVDPSAAVQKILMEIFNSHPRLEVVATVGEASRIESAIAQHRPHVITYDVKMPRHAGQDVLQKILSQHLIPVVVISAASKEESQQVLGALENGAVDSLQKPSLDEIRTLGSVWAERILEAASIKVHKHRVSGAAPPRAKSLRQTVRQLSPFVIMGASTGGVQALTEVLTQMPNEIPPILIVQHIPPVFSASFADRLNSLCPFTVKEAVDGDLVQENQVLIAPGGKHMEVISSKHGYRVQVADGAPVNRHKPAVDILFASAAHHFGTRAIGILLTGMGMDGAAGLKKMKDHGARTIVQDEASSAVFGMPKEAIRLGAADIVSPLDQVHVALLRLIKETGLLRKIS
ncbi:MAG: chemotaxis-specific protein-glutamate methyltransferase CheB [Pseudobdellovibrionaceae bacterium]|nr:chemotaxis-specific protein-glutamate methyltransferase CheB [Pseudobdellovibrionaceae bacterium]